MRAGIVDKQIIYSNNNLKTSIIITYETIHTFNTNHDATQPLLFTSFNKVAELQALQRTGKYRLTTSCKASYQDLHWCQAPADNTPRYKAAIAHNTSCTPTE
jgi:hypothetical protein